LIRKIGSRGVLYLSLLCYALRLLYYSFLTNPWAVLPAELLHGVTFAAFWSASVNLASENSPPSLSATSQGLLSAFYEGLGTGTGTLVGGFIYEKYGAVVLFFFTSITLFFCLFFFVIYQIFRKFFTPNLKTFTLLDQNENEIELNIKPIILEGESCQSELK